MKINLLEDWERYWGVEPYPTDGKEKQRKYYNHHAGESPEIITDENGDTIFRLNAVRHDEDNSYRTAAICTKQLYGPGKWTVVARFHGGNGTWPAIWMHTRVPEGLQHPYEIDLCEYFQRRPWCKTGYFCHASVKYWYYRLFRPKKHPFINPKWWNKFECEWDENRIIVRVNNNEVLRYKNKGDRRFYPQENLYLEYRLILSMQYNKPGLLPIRLKQLPLWMDVKEATYEPKIND